MLQYVRIHVYASVFSPLYAVLTYIVLIKGSDYYTLFNSTALTFVEDTYISLHAVSTCSLFLHQSFNIRIDLYIVVLCSQTLSIINSTLFYHRSIVINY
jgi:hypothetical protein